MQLHLSMDEAPVYLPADESQPATHSAPVRADPPHRLPEPFFLQNFRSVLGSLSQRYAHLLSGAELAFIHGFAGLPARSQRLLTRMLMRKGAHFRRATLQYPEVTDLEAAIGGLVDIGWLDIDPVVTLGELRRILLREEWRNTFRTLARPRSVADNAAQLALPFVSEPPTARALSQWNCGLANVAVRLVIEPTARRLQWLYFGNDRQTWAEFVVSDLGLKRYEQVPFDSESCAFKRREEIEHFYRLHECRARLRADECAESILKHAFCPPTVAEWLQTQFGRLQLHLGERLQRQGRYELALTAYRRCTTPEGHIKVVHLKERLGLHAEARDEALLALQLPCREIHRDEIGRALGRLGRHLGEKVRQAKRPVAEVLQLTVPELSENERVERRACAHLSTTDCRTFYVENSLFPSMFGLLCWEAIFAPLPGAFFHPFQSGPADLYAAEFRSRRAAQFESLLGLLDSSQHEEVIWRHYRDKARISSNFVRWGRLKPEILSLALACIPPRHLKLVFERFLADLDENCAGLPDLVQFWPDDRRYRLVEIKAPGDRLQYNQRRWMQFFTTHDIPAAVCKIAWEIQPQ